MFKRTKWKQQAHHHQTAYQPVTINRPDKEEEQNQISNWMAHLVSAILLVHGK